MDAYPKPANQEKSATAAAAHGTDVENLKTDIPYFDDPSIKQPQQQQQQQQKQLKSNEMKPQPQDDFDAAALLVLGKTETDLDEYTPADWAEVDADNQQTDDNASALSSDYAASGSAANSYYQSPTPSNSDLMLRPPSNSSFHYNYPSPGSSVASPGGGGVPLQLQSRHSAYAHSQQQQQQQLGPPAPGFYANMWYPNAPYGNGGSSAGGGYGRYYGTGPGPYLAPPTHSHPLHPHHYHTHPPPLPPAHHTHPHAHPHETMMEMFQLSNSGREARNRAEKNRRDKLNGSIQELSTMVPHVAESPRRVDKTAVLRFAAHGLRLKHAFGKALHQQSPQITDTLMHMLDSFFITVTCHGQILLISSSIEQHLGHCQTDLYGQSIMQITHPDDQNMLKQQLIPTELENLFDTHAESDAEGEPRQRSKSEEDYIDRKLREDRRSFRVRLARAGPRSEPTAYEVVKIDGCFRRSDEAPRGVRSNTFSSSLQLIRRTRGRDDNMPLHTISGNDIILTACARIIRPPKIVSRLIDANSLEYRTRHLIDGRIVDCDQRISIVAGYMTDEVRNLSPFTFMHNDDVRWVIVALRQMYDCNSSYGESTYRLFTRNGNIIYLQTKGYLEIDKESNRVHSFVCVNTLLDEEEGKRRVQEMKKKFSVIINTQIPQSTIDVPASEHPAQLEKAVLCLIQNLQKSASDEDTDQQDGDDEDDVDEADDDEDDDVDSLATSMSEFGEATFHYHQPGSSSASSTSMQQSRLHSSHGTSSSKTPPLALVPPETSSVKSAISKSVSVVNVTAAKHLRNAHTAPLKSPSSVLSCTCPIAGANECEFCQDSLTTEPPAPPTAIVSNLKRCSGLNPEAEEVKLSKRRYIHSSTEIEQVLSTSLVQIGRKLHQQLNVARNLRDQGNRYELPHANQRIDEIMEEHQKQSELYVNIKSEYEVQLQNKANNVTNTTTKSETDPQGGHNDSSH